MAKETLVRLIDDIDGAPIGDGGETITFALNGRSYEIDLSSTNSARLRGALDEFIAFARPLKSDVRASSSRGVRRSSERNVDDVRAWARAHGHTVSDRGRIAVSILNEYDAAH